MSSKVRLSWEITRIFLKCIWEITAPEYDCEFFRYNFVFRNRGQILQYSLILIFLIMELESTWTSKKKDARIDRPNWCNGTRPILKDNTIADKIIGSEFQGDIRLVPRIKIILSKGDKYTFIKRRVPSPVSLL